jgi:hypothetical protein
VSEIRDGVIDIIGTMEVLPCCLGGTIEQLMAFGDKEIREILEEELRLLKLHYYYLFDLLFFENWSVCIDI